MAKKNRIVPARYIAPLYMNGLQGRMLYLPPKRKGREILFVYGHHANIERLYGIAKELNKYGAVTMPDLPGFGGMDSFYKIHEQPSIDNLADYLASFIQLRYRRRRLTIVGLSFGFAVVTRMLQRYPELAKRVDLLISVVGFAHRDDFTFSKTRTFMYRMGAGLFSVPPFSIFFKNICLHPWVIKRFYGRTYNARKKFARLSATKKREAIEFETVLWRCNDVRTYMKTSVQMLTIDNCQSQVDLPVWHVSAKNDRYVDNHLVEQHMRIIFSDFTNVPSKMSDHGPTIIADAKAAAPYVPQKIRQLLRGN